jgi:hypothetical protein
VNVQVKVQAHMPVQSKCNEGDGQVQVHMRVQVMVQVQFQVLVQLLVQYLSAHCLR